MNTPTTTPAQLFEAGTIEVIEVLGPTLEILAPLDLPDDAPCGIRGTIPPGGVVPLHSHGDPETFLALAGDVEGLIVRETEPTWVQVAPGDVFHVPGDAKHAWRNRTEAASESLIVTTGKIARFFREVARLAGTNGASLPDAAMEHFLATADRYGYWNATPEENAAVGIVLP
jgi:quercetin dioxygenase-like cupin family protein